MDIRLTNDSKFVLDEWVTVFQSGGIHPKRKRLLNAIVHIYAYRDEHVLKSIDFSRRLGIPTSKEYDLKKETEGNVETLIRRIEKEKGVILKPSELVNFLVELSGIERDMIRGDVKNYLVDDLKEDPKQICFDLPVEFLEEVEKSTAKIRKKQGLNEYLSRQLDLFTLARTELEIKEMIENLLKAQSQTPIPLSRLPQFTVLNVSEEAKRKLSRVCKPAFDARVRLLLGHAVGMSG